MIKLLILMLPIVACAEPVGHLNSEVTQDTIDSTICVSNWTKTIRPPTSYTNKLKLAQMRALGLSGSPTRYEEDHFIPLELGGHPTDERNLWPEPRDGENNARDKDKLETHLHSLVCNKDDAKRISLKDAQSCIIDWQNCQR